MHINMYITIKIELEKRNQLLLLQKPCSVCSGCDYVELIFSIFSHLAFIVPHFLSFAFSLSFIFYFHFQLISLAIHFECFEHRLTRSFTSLFGKMYYFIVFTTVHHHIDIHRQNPKPNSAREVKNSQ